MKRKIVMSLLICTVVLAGCGDSNAPADVAPAPSTEMIVPSTDEDTSESSSIGDIEVEKNIFSVKLTVPAEYVGETTQEELSATASEKGYKSITLNDDGSATYIMSKKQHKEMMDDMAAEINNDLSKMIGSEEFPNITDIKTNDDFTEFTVTTSSTELDLSESFTIFPFYVYGGMYSIFNGTPIDNIHVDFVNADSGEIVESFDSSEPGGTEQPQE